MERRLQTIVLKCLTTKIDILELVQKDLDLVINTLAGKIEYNPSLWESIEYSISTKGKMKRPVLVYLCYLCLNEAINDSLRYAASSIELMHTASLIHDDIVDNGTVRRGKVSACIKFGLTKSIITGDYLIFSSINLLAMAGVDCPKILEVIKVMSEIYSKMCMGQSMEEQLIGNIEASVELYFQLIEAKTAIFFAGVCETGGIIAGGCEEECRAFYDFGYNLGLAYQIRDDILDFINRVSHKEKFINSDIERRLVTLPVIIAYKNGTSRQKNLLYGFYRKAYSIKISDIQEIIYTTSAIDESILTVKGYINKAIHSLEVIKESEWKRSLKAFANSLNVDNVSDNPLYRVNKV